MGRAYVLGAAASAQVEAREYPESQFMSGPALPEWERSPKLSHSLAVAVRYTLITTILFGLVYPLGITLIAQLAMRDKADGQLITSNGDVIGSALIGQNFTAEKYFHGRPSAAGNGYDAANSGGSNLAQSNAALIDRIQAAIAAYQKQNPDGPVPIELVTASASGLDPDISPAAAYYQVPAIAKARHLPADTVRRVVQDHIRGRQLGILGEPHVNVLELNLALDAVSAADQQPIAK